eukprot:12313481-Alexandrium_andersonii.AAC.1
MELIFCMKSWRTSTYCAFRSSSLGSSPCAATSKSSPAVANCPYALVMSQTSALNVCLLSPKGCASRAAVTSGLDRRPALAGPVLARQRRQSSPAPGRRPRNARAK